MREYSVPAVVTVPDDHNTTTILWENADNHPDSVVYAIPEGDDWRDVTLQQFRDEVIAVAKGLAAAGIKPGDRVGLMSRTRYEWTLLDYAIWSAGCVVVPIYETSSADQAQWILSDSGAVACFTEAPRHTEIVDSVKDQLPELTKVWEIDAGCVAELSEAGKESDADVDALRAHHTAEGLATIIYTSGTTGRPKGCTLTHRNLLADIGNTLPGLHTLFHPGATTLLFLPLAHTLARIIQIGALQARVRIGHVPDTKAIAALMPDFKPTFLLAVPRVFEKVYNSAEQKAIDGGGLKKSIFYKAVQTAIDYSKSLDTGGPGFGLKLKHGLFDKLVYSKLRAALGGRCKSAVSGGAPLGERLAHFYRGVGVTIYEGYGLTETSPVVSINLETALRIGSIGRPIPSTTVKIADDGELLIKGPQVFKGYWNNEDATKEAFDADGWFKSGDIAKLDADGFVTITGRSKEIIVTAGGKNVAPAPMEDKIRSHPLVGQVLVVGDQKPFIGALIALDPEALPGWLERHELPADTQISTLVDNAEVLEQLQDAVNAANKTVSNAEAIKKFRVLSAALTEETGEVTPKQSVRRNVVLAKYADDFEALYSS
ncbi:AMP-dependent synthetase/ligase [Stackebrandtia soli]|uniref:AMP-dependent synthetase/ligase n=1 Tax=Stackebrandtia soli TaxID=1892856 RepID=UPI0039EB3CB5